MNKIFKLLIAGSILMACNSGQTNNATDNQDEEKVSKDFLNDISSLEDVADPIKTFIDGAEKVATKKENFTLDNADDLIDEARAYAYTVIVVEDHTVVILRDIDDCQESLAWDTCMPKAEGYINKGELVYQDDYINNIIGLPDEKKRTIYFFSE